MSCGVSPRGPIKERVEATRFSYGSRLTACQLNETPLGHWLGVIPRFEWAVDCIDDSAPTPRRARFVSLEDRVRSRFAAGAADPAAPGREGW